MSRQTNFYGLTESAHDWLELNCKKEKHLPINNMTEDIEKWISEHPEVNSEDIQSFITGYKYCAERMSCETLKMKLLGSVTGMFDEEVYVLRQYETNDGRFVEEFVQADPWSSGPCIFLGLRYSNGGGVISETLWNDEDIMNC
jgi:hypothetical protein